MHRALCGRRRAVPVLRGIALHGVTATRDGGQSTL